MYPVATRQAAAPKDPTFWAVFNGERPSPVSLMLIRDGFADKSPKTPVTWLEHVVRHDELWGHRVQLDQKVEGVTRRILENQTALKTLRKEVSSQPYESLDCDPMFLMDDSPQALLHCEEIAEKDLVKDKSSFEKERSTVEMQRQRVILAIQAIQAAQLGDDRKGEAEQFIENPEVRYRGLRTPFGAAVSRLGRSTSNSSSFDPEMLIALQYKGPYSNTSFHYEQTLTPETPMKKASS